MNKKKNAWVRSFKKHICRFDFVSRIHRRLGQVCAIQASTCRGLCRFNCCLQWRNVKGVDICASEVAIQTSPQLCFEVDFCFVNFVELHNLNHFEKSMVMHYMLLWSAYSDCTVLSLYLTLSFLLKARSKLVCFCKTTGDRWWLWQWQIQT